MIIRYDSRSRVDHAQKDDLICIERLEESLAEVPTRLSLEQRRAVPDGNPTGPLGPQRELYWSRLRQDRWRW